MVVVTWRRVLTVAPMLTLVGCVVIAGYRDFIYVPASTECSSPSLPSTGSGRIRLVNAGTKGSASDFCVRASGTSSWGQSVLAETGPDCQGGLAYAQATLPFSAPAGRIDVKAIKAGSTCEAEATSQAGDLAIGDSTTGAPVVTVLRMGGGANGERIVALSEEPSASPQNAVRIRLVNALSGGGAINFGLTSAPALPATIVPSLPHPLAVGGVEPAGNTSIGVVDPNGYLAFEALGLELGAVFDGHTSALFVFTTAPKEDTETLFAIGDPSDASHAIRGLRCEDSASQVGSEGTDAGVADSGAVPGAPRVLADCTLTGLASIAVDMFNVSLYGSDAPFEGERRQAIYDAIAARQTDLMCLTEIDSEADKTGVAAAASARFPFAYFPDPPTDLDTPATDPSELDGGPPLTSSSPPCGDGVSADDVNSVYACVAEKCADTGDMSGRISKSDNCLSQECQIPFARLFQRSAQANACFDCILYYLTSRETLAYGKNACLTDKRPPFAFNGQTTAMMLSHYPLSNQRTLVLPSTGWRRSILYSQVQLEDQSVDFYCAALTTAANDTLLPYTGSYGMDRATLLPDGGQQLENGWEDEQDLQVERTIAFIRETSGKTGRPAIIAGDWNATVGVADGGTVILGDLSPEVMIALGEAFTIAAPPGSVPACTLCPAPENPYNGSGSPEDETQVLLSGFAPGSTLDGNLWGTANTVPILGGPYEPPPAGGMGPLSAHYPRVVYVLRPRVE